MATYIGNGAYCYANATAMLLASIGEGIQPGQIEALTGVGLGASIQEGSQTLWFGNLASAPDTGISKALELLGFAFTERIYPDEVGIPSDELRAALAAGPVLLGPVDMGYLSYVPYHKHLEGADHFVLAYDIDAEAVHLHDPAGYPCVMLPIEGLASAWRAERIPYRQGAFRSWTAPHRIDHPSDDDVYTRALAWFAECYRTTDLIVAERRYGTWQIGEDALRGFADSIRDGEVPNSTRGHLTGFALQLGARRALDYATFFERCDPDLASLKREQARLFGRGHTRAVDSAWPALAATLQELANVEAQFREALLARAETTLGEPVML